MTSNLSNKTDSIPLHRVAVVRPFVQFLETVGAPVKHALSKAGLPYDALEFVDNYIPSQCFWTFLVDMAYGEGINDLGFRVGEQFSVSVIDPQMPALLQQSPTLYHGLLKASEVVNRTVTHCRLGVLQPSNSNYSYFYHQPSCSADNPAVEQIGCYGLTVLVDIVRAYAGPQWSPKEIGVMTKHAPDTYIKEYFPNSRFRLSQPYTCIALENALLSLPPIPGKTQGTVPSEDTYISLPDKFASSLQMMLQSYVLNTKTNLDMTAKLCNLSKRTMQRRLGDEGTCFNKVLGQARFHVASRMLEDPTMKITQLAKQLGYSDVAHFSRAFRRIAGATPSAYRQQQLAQGI